MGPKIYPNPEPNSKAEELSLRSVRWLELPRRSDASHPWLLPPGQNSLTVSIPLGPSSTQRSNGSETHISISQSKEKKTSNRPFPSKTKSSQTLPSPSLSHSPLSLNPVSTSPTRPPNSSTNTLLSSPSSSQVPAFLHVSDSPNKLSPSTEKSPPFTTPTHIETTPFVASPGF